ncbi:response regulator [Luteibaculum oceani]|uniref:Response regulator n=1 Tax=Luteibaculum oceani TaxID=1294296 RepID=A0A5C6UVN4_9FLAO|nr:response regulator [Luteibaculum oceani]TXC76196.1 response regulator [Luteibaculum oceani]
MTAGDKLGSILLIDDDPASNFLNGTIIKKVGITAHIQVAAKAQDALDYISKTGMFQGASHDKPDLIFVDINMPRMNGWEFIEQFKRLPKNLTEGSVVVMLTTSDNPQDRQRAAEQPEIQAFISKPLSKSKLSGLVSKYFPGQIF